MAFDLKQIVTLEVDIKYAQENKDTKEEINRKRTKI